MKGKILPRVRFPSPWLAVGACFAITAVRAQVPAQPIQSPDELARAAESFVLARIGPQPGSIHSYVTAGPVDPRLRLARCTQALQPVLPPVLRDSARLTVGVQCAAPAWSVYLPVRIETEMPVLVLRTAQPRGATPSASDVELQSRRVPGMAAGHLTDPARLAGRHLRMPATPGTVLTEELFAPDVVVKRGQRVTLVAAAGGIEVRAQGEAIADATSGGRVRVLNLSSRRIVEGQVESADLVRITL